MNTKKFEYGMHQFQMQSTDIINSCYTSVFSVHHSSHHHEHSAH